MCYAAAVGYCCFYRLLLLQSKYSNLLLPIHEQTQHAEYFRHTAAAQIAYVIITHSRSIQVERFRGTLKVCCEKL